MARIKDRQKAIKLRKKGMTYSEIRKKLNIPKSTLSDWLSKYSLTENQLRLLAERVEHNKQLAVEKCRQTKLKKRKIRLGKVYQKEKQKYLPLSRREFYLAGLFLYWGEGSKHIRGSISLSNTDPKVLKFYLRWLARELKIPKSKIRICLHLYSDMNVDKAFNFWSSELKIPLSQFNKPYIKASRKTEIDHKGFGYGTCALSVSSVRLKERIIMGIEAIADYYSKKI